MAHPHQHSTCGSSACDHDHSGDLPSGSSLAGDKSSLYSVIDRENVVALNAVEGPEMGKRVIKVYDQKDDETEFCESDADDSLIISIPFTAQVKLRSITIKAGPGGFTPEKVKLFVNSPGLDFSSVEDKKPDQELQLVPNKEAVEYGVRPAKFSGLTSLELFFPNNVSHGDDEETSRVYYIGLSGEWTDLTKNPTGVIVYEAQANPSDHKVKGTENLASSRLGM